MPSFGTLKADTLTHSTAGSLATNFVVEGSSKSWIHGSTAAVPQDSLNVSSGTDNGTGDYTYTVTSTMGNTTFSQQVSCNGGELCAVKNAAFTTTHYSIITYTRASSFTAADQLNYGNLKGDLA